MHDRPLHLHVTTTTADPATTRVLVRAENHGDCEVYWLNRFWTGGPDGAAWDPRGPYRHEQAGVLRLLYGAAPVPANTLVSARYVPHATRIAGGAAVTVEVELVAPVTEFALFNPPNARSEYDEVTARELAVIAHYVLPSEGVSVGPSHIDAAYFFVRMGSPHLRVAEAVVPVVPIDVRRRRDPIARVQLSTERVPAIGR